MPKTTWPEASAKEVRAMIVKRISLFLYFLMAPIALQANQADGDARLERLFGMFISPCCWRENLLTHASPTADGLRNDIRHQVGASKTDEEIKQYVLSAYSTRVLAMPEGVAGQWLSWMPWIFFAMGLAVISKVIWNSAGRVRTTGDAAAAVALPDSVGEEL